MTGRWRRLVREPLVHFFAAGALLFVLYTAVGGPEQASSGEVVVDQARVEALRAGFERLRSRPPNHEELQALVDAWVEEEILVREARALGLQQGDTLIRRRLAQKMAWITQGTDVERPTEDELRAWWADHPTDYTAPATVSLRQVAYGGETLPPSAAAVVGSTAVPPAATVEGLPAVLQDADSAGLVATFGEDFATRLDGLPTGTWQGPIRSPFGVHLVLVTERAAPEVVPFAQARPHVLRDLSDARTAAAGEAAMARLRERYEVRVTSDAYARTVAEGTP